jgi:RNA polymerase sigma factor (sigma-70 family)
MHAVNDKRKGEKMENINRLVSSTLKGNKDAFAKIYNQYFERIYRFIYYRTFHRETAEDITGQTFLKALEYLRSYDPSKGKFNTWLYKISVNCINKHFNKNKETENYEDIWDTKAGNDFVIDVEQKILYERIQPFLAGLPSEKRSIIVMRIWDDLSYAEIAKILEKNEAACRMIFSRTMEELRSHMPDMAVMMAAFSFIFLK